MEAFLEAWLISEEPEAPMLVPFDFAQGKRELDGIEVYRLKTDKRTIEIKQVREMLGAIAKTSWRGKRLVVVEDAEKLSLPAVQALLKTLEEPSKTNRFLLVTKFPGRLPATVLSRCQRLPTTPSPRHSPGYSPSPEGEKSLDPVAWLGQKGRKGLSDDQLDAITRLLDERVREGEGPGVQRALLRLRDYYKIRALGGGEKLAADVLLASLVEMDKMKA